MRGASTARQTARLPARQPPKKRPAPSTPSSPLCAAAAPAPSAFPAWLGKAWAWPSAVAAGWPSTAGTGCGCWTAGCSVAAGCTIEGSPVAGCPAAGCSGCGDSARRSASRDPTCSGGHGASMQECATKALPGAQTAAAVQRERQGQLHMANQTNPQQTPRGPFMQLGPSRPGRNRHRWKLRCDVQRVAWHATP